MNRNLFNLEKLIRSGQERVRLTEQLQELVCEAVYEIAEAVSVGTKVTVAGETFAVLEFCSNIGCTTQFCLIKDADFGYAVIFDDGHEPGLDSTYTETSTVSLTTPHVRTSCTWQTTCQKL